MPLEGPLRGGPLKGAQGVSTATYAQRSSRVLLLWLGVGMPAAGALGAKRGACSSGCLGSNA